MQILGILTLAMAYFLGPHQFRDLNRHSFGRHLLYGHVHPKILRVRMGHEKYESTEVNLRFLRSMWLPATKSSLHWIQLTRCSNCVVEAD